MGFMRSLNQGDVEALVADAITEQALSASGVDAWRSELRALHTASGGLRVLQVLAADEYQVMVMMQGNGDGQPRIIEMKVSEDYPHQVSEFIERTAGA